MEFTAKEELMALAIGTAVLKYLKDDETMQQLLADMESKAIQVLEDIRTVLDDSSLDDPTCFRRIEAIVDLYIDNHLGTSRHDW